MHTKLYAKAADNDQILDRVTRGADGVEIQLLDKKVDINMDLAKIVSVHAALYDGKDTCFDNIVRRQMMVTLDSTDTDNFIEAALLAEKVASARKRRVNVVMHVGQVKCYYRPELYASILESLFERFPNINILLEHNTVVSLSFGSRGVWNASDLPNFIDSIRECLPDSYKDRLGAVLDVCHALGNIRIRQVLENESLEFNSFYEKEMLEQWFKSFYTCCKLIHLNYGKGLTLGKNHGAVPTKEEAAILKELIQKYLPEALLVVEVREEDVRFANNFSKMRELFKEETW